MVPFQNVAQLHVVVVACLVAAVEVPGLASQVLRMSLLVYTSVIGTCVVAPSKNAVGPTVLDTILFIASFAVFTTDVKSIVVSLILWTTSITVPRNSRVHPQQEPRVDSPRKDLAISKSSETCFFSRTSRTVVGLG